MATIAIGDVHGNLPALEETVWAGRGLGAFHDDDPCAVSEQAGPLGTWALRGMVEVGQEARVRIDAYPNRSFDGVVTEVGSSPMDPDEMQQQTEAIKFKVKVEIKDPPATIKPGLSVQADILTGFAGQAVVVPLQALVVRDVPREEGEEREPGAPREEEGVYLPSEQQTGQREESRHYQHVVDHGRDGAGAVTK